MTTQTFQCQDCGADVMKTNRHPRKRCGECQRLAEIARVRRWQAANPERVKAIYRAHYEKIKQARSQAKQTISPPL